MVDYDDTLNELKILHLNTITEFFYLVSFLKKIQITYIIKKGNIYKVKKKN